MILSYLARLLCVCLASFFLIHFLLSLLTRAATRSAVGFASRSKLPRALALLIAIRALPAAIGVVAVFLLCIPSYLWFEPSAMHEHVGVACCSAAALAVVLFADAIIRSARAIHGTWRFTQHCQKNGKLVKLPDESSAVLVVNSSSPILTLAGVFHPQLVASQSVLDGLSPDELSAALLHERAHRGSRDNLRRLLLMICPRLPFAGGSRELERTWARWAEWQADDRAANEDPERSISLASALVRIARMGLSRPMPPLCANFVSGENELQQRVERLLRTGSEPHDAYQPAGRHGLRAAIAAVAIGSILGLALLQPATLHSVHEILEKLIH
jgi:beta-lactamase regulating signal transducer with metallopeptidase domain